jgi:NAD+ synthase
VAIDLSIDPQAILAVLIAFIKDMTTAAGRSRLVVGLSGGLDSATASYLAVLALGKENLDAFLMPYKTSSVASLEDGLLVTRELGVHQEVIEITPVVDSYLERYPGAGQKRIGNFCVRTRMAILYDQSEVHDALVMGTGNLTESLFGYTTLWGDMACAFRPLGALYKTQVRQLARHIGVPERIIEKQPSADLWAGQTDEGEMGLTYDEADKLLHGMIDLGLSDRELEGEGFGPDLIARVKRMVDAAAFKRCMPPSPSTKGADPNVDPDVEG